MAAKTSKSKSIKKGKDRIDYSISDTKSKKTIIIGAEDAPVLYADSIEVDGTLFDIKLRLRHVVKRSEDEITYKETAVFCLSAPHAKTLSEVLAKHVAVYEAEFGTIPTGPRTKVDERVN